MRNFVVKVKLGGPDLWRTGVVEKAMVKAPNVPRAVYEFHKKFSDIKSKMTVTEVYESR